MKNKHNFQIQDEIFTISLRSPPPFTLHWVWTVSALKAGERLLWRPVAHVICGCLSCHSECWKAWGPRARLGAPPRSRLVTTSNRSGRGPGPGPPQPLGHGFASFNDSLFSIRLLCTSVNAILDKFFRRHLGRAFMGIKKLHP